MTRVFKPRHYPFLHVRNDTPTPFLIYGSILMVIKMLLWVILQTLLVSEVVALTMSDIHNHGAGIWSIASPPKLHRWIVIHDVAASQAAGIYHIEVIQRVKGAPVWAIKHLVKHMAITADALQRSVRKPLTKGAVYPESFMDGYAEWRQANDGRGGEVCNATVMLCFCRKYPNSPNCLTR